MHTISFAVRSKHFSIYRAFKEEMEAIGYAWNAEFNPFNRNRFKETTCIYVGNAWQSLPTEPLMSFSNPMGCTVFNLDGQFDLALGHAKRELEKAKASQAVTVELNDSYEAIVHDDKVTVGCQTFSADSIQKLFDAAKKKGLIK